MLESPVPECAGPVIPLWSESLQLCRGCALLPGETAVDWRIQWNQLMESMEVHDFCNKRFFCLSEIKTRSQKKTHNLLLFVPCLLFSLVSFFSVYILLTLEKLCCIVTMTLVCTVPRT